MAGSSTGLEKPMFGAQHNRSRYCAKPTVLSSVFLKLRSRYNIIIKQFKNTIMIRKFYGMEFGDFNGNMNEDIYTKKHDSKPPITHETFVIGFNENGDVIFLKSYEYLKQKDEAQSDLKWVIDNCHHWEIGAAREWKLMHQHLLHDIIIPHP